MTVDEALARAAELENQNQFAQAEQLYRQVLSVVPNHLPALVRLASIAHQFGHQQAAAQLAQRAVQLAPDAQAYTVLGSALKLLGHPAEAEQALRRAVEVVPFEPAAHCNLAMSLWESKKLAEARREYERALELNPAMALALHGIMTVAGDMGDFQAAAEAGMRAEQLGLNTARFFGDYAIALLDVGDLDGALAAAERAVALEPNNPTIRFNLSQFLLLKGDFERGWKEFEYRWGSERFPSPKRSFPAPMWDGTSNRNQTVLLHAEQGFGDAIMFARYIPMVAERVGVLVECQPELVDLLKSVEGIEKIIPRGQKLDHFDAHAPFMSLAMILGTTVQTIPSRTPYISAPQDRVARWRERLGQGNSFRVGLTWAGSPTHQNDANRSMRLELLEPLSQIKRVEYYSLQKGDRATDAKAASWLVDLTPDIQDFADLAAIVENLDLIISVDTSVVHVAGALAKPVWVMLPFAPDWRWLMSYPESSPWYPTMRLFRQSRPRDWGEVVGRVGMALDATSGG